MKDRWAYEEIEKLITDYLQQAKEWLLNDDKETAYRFLVTAIKLREIK